MKRIILAIIAGVLMVNSAQATRSARLLRRSPQPTQQTNAAQVAAQKAEEVKKAEESRLAQVAAQQKQVEAARVLAAQQAAAKKEAEKGFFAKHGKKLAIALGVTVAAVAGVVGTEAYCVDWKMEDMFNANKGLRAKASEQYKAWFPTEKKEDKGEEN